MATRERKAARSELSSRPDSLRNAERHTLAEVGKFCVVGTDDLVELAYAGDRSKMESDIRNLETPGACQATKHQRPQKDSRPVLTLTKQVPD